MWPHHDQGRIVGKIEITGKDSAATADACFCAIKAESVEAIYGWLYGIYYFCPLGFFMQLNHIGLNIATVSEIQDFYQAILGLFPERDFAINRQISQTFFGINNETHAFILRNENLILELFVYGKPISTGYAHLCVEVPDREETVCKCMAKGYQTIRMKRENSDLLFVKDKAGNVFELKNIQHENLS